MKKFIRFLFCLAFISVFAIVLNLGIGLSIGNATTYYDDDYMYIKFNDTLYKEVEIPMSYSCINTSGFKYDIRDDADDLYTFCPNYDENCNMLSHKENLVFGSDKYFVKVGMEIPCIERDTVESVALATDDRYFSPEVTELIDDASVLDDLFKSLKSYGKIPVSRDTCEKLSLSADIEYIYFKIKDLPILSNYYDLVCKNGAYYVYLDYELTE